jgi:hypothetical protein
VALDEGDGLVVALGLGVQVAGKVTVCAEGGDEGGDGDGGGVSEELGDLDFCQLESKSRREAREPYLGNAADVLDAVLVGEAKVLVEAEADVVTVEAVGVDAEVEEVLLESGGDGGLAGAGETGHPDGETTLAVELIALLAREGRVPVDVAACLVVSREAHDWLN